MCGPNVRGDEDSVILDTFRRLGVFRWNTGVFRWIRFGV